MLKNKLNLHMETTPTLDTNQPNTPLHTETHRTVSKEIEKSEKNIIKTRQEILKHYNIEDEKSIHFPAVSSKEARDICAFFILKNKNQPNEIYYADGHTAHANLFQLILNKFGEKIGYNSRTELAKNFLKNWETKKGFIDPYQNGFQKFETINYALKQIIAEQNNGDYSLDEADKITTTVDKLPNWFTASSSSSRQKK